MGSRPSGLAGNGGVGGVSEMGEGKKRTKFVTLEGGKCPKSLGP